MSTWIVAGVVAVVALVVAIYNFGQAVEWLVRTLAAVRARFWPRAETPEERAARLWLTVQGISPALGPGAPVRGTPYLETSLSIYLHIINRHPQNKVSLRFRLDDPDTPTKSLWAAGAGEFEVRRMPHIPAYRDLCSPVAVGPQEEVEGNIFFYSGPPKTMPVRTLVIVDSIHHGEFPVELPARFREIARQVDWHPR